MLDLTHYRILETAYEGSETVVYRGLRLSDGAKVAIKLTRSEYPTARELIRLRREFAILKEIEALPGVVRALSLEKRGRGLLLVMEDLGPLSLHELLKAGRLEPKTLLQIAVSLSRTLAALHGLRVIHKDIKPRNILIDEATLAPRLVDFGIATRLSQEAQKAKSPDSIEGTPAYMSPEQTGQMNRVVDLRTDLYSLGATLYEMLTGEPPFSAASPLELINSHIARTPTPPHERAREVPEGLSDVVMKLLSKMPEERYQSARGLGADLAACLDAWERQGQIEPFELGREDIALDLRISQKLYDREDEIRALVSAFDRARAGAVELVLISGYAGVGKSALVSELKKPIAEAGGYIGHGKFDELSRSTPLAPFAHALSELVRQALTEPSAALAALKQRLTAAVGASGRLLIDLVPELGLLIGSQPEVPKLQPNEEQGRFGRLVQRFVQAFTASERPACVFLDDLQWADPATLRLLGELLRGPDAAFLLVVGAYRDNEIDAAHPLSSLITELGKASVSITEITLGPLTERAVTALVADTFSQTAAAALPLASLVLEKTRGNPFFLSQFLRTLHDEDLVRIDAGQRAWTWDLQRIWALSVTDNVVDLLLGELKRLAPETQRALRLAACIGHEFDLRTLSTIERRRPADTASALGPALKQGFVLPLDGDYRLFEASDAEAEAPDFGVRYRFLHGRVQEAAYALIELAQKAEVHQQIGSLLWARSGEAPEDEDLLEIVRHLNLGRRPSDEAGRAGVARLNLRAGRKARAATAYKAAVGYYTAGIELLGDAGRAIDPELSLTLERECAECSHLAGEIERAELMFEELLPRISSRLERARIQGTRVALHMMRERFVDALRTGLECMALLGVTLPKEEAEARAALEAEMAAVDALIGDRAIEELARAPVATDPERRVLAEMLSSVSLPLYYVSVPLYSLVITKHVRLCLEHGNSEVSSLGYMSYGFMLTHTFGQYERGYAFGKLALALHATFPSAAQNCRQYTTFTLFSYVREPARAALAYQEKAYSIALSTGDFLFLTGVSYRSACIKWFSGYQLSDLREDLDKGLAFTRRTGNALRGAAIIILKQVIASLMGRTRSPVSLHDDLFDEEAFIGAPPRKHHAIVLFEYYVLKLRLFYLFGDDASALAAAEKAEELRASAVGPHTELDLAFYMCLASLSASSTLLASPAAGARTDVVAGHRARLATLAALAPSNFEHKLRLIEAEEALRDKNYLAAFELYDQAITLARANEYSQDEALANELAAKAYLSLGRLKAACGYMTDAHLGYLHWGAITKVEDISTRYGHVLRASGASSSRGSSSSSSSSSSDTTSGTTLVSRTMAKSLKDAALIMRAAQAIVSEVDLPRVLERLMKIVLENAAARRGVLLLERAGGLFVEARFRMDPEQIELVQGAPAEAERDLAQRVVRLAARTREPVMLDDARADERFSGDPSIAERGVRSILCLPLLYQGRLIGVMYLENEDTAGAFDRVREEVISLLSAQAAIAIENARMVASVQAANERVVRINGELGALVDQRTEEIRRSNEELRGANARLLVELTQREQAERQREELQAQVLEAERARLAELSTPLIPITDRIMVLPLIGSLYAERAAQVLEVTLRGVQRHRARVVILDITGIKHIDGDVVGTLGRTAAALRLLGAEAVITGISAPVARAMVELNIDTSGLVTLGTLQSGIAFALSRSGEPLGRGARKAAKPAASRRSPPRR